MATKLYAILLIPVVLALAFGGLRVADAVDTWQEADDAERTTELVGSATAYAHALIDERDLTARPILEGDTGSSAISEARLATDTAQLEFWEAVSRAPDTESLRRRIEEVSGAETALESLRRNAYRDGMPGVQTEEGYVAIQHPLMSLANELRLNANATSYGRAVYALSLSKSASSLQRAIGTHLLVAPGPSEEEAAVQLTAFSSYTYLENVALAEFSSASTPEDAELLDDAMARAAAEVSTQMPEDGPGLTQMALLIASGTAEEDLEQQGVTAESWFDAATTEFDAYRGVEEELVAKALTEARDLASTARRDVAINSAIVIGSLLLAFVIAGLMARSMSQNTRRLRGAAIEVAEQRLPAVVDQLSRVDPGRVDTQVAPIPINSRDEFGEVARAFDQVHRVAVRLAGEQALLRGNVNAIFTNLSARNQGLIERQLALIGELENHEADPEQLENLFKLDHLATRMRRNGENLLVLAGKEPGRRWNQPVPLVDALRGAASEVEAYDRIEISGVPECEIHGAVVNDLVHLLAELLENATSFSSPHTRVRVTATRLPDGRVMVEIHDKGIGLTQEDFAGINERLANPPAVDADVSRRMGLFVVGRLAQLHGIRVQLRPSGEQTGTTSLVMLPEAITHGGGGERQPAEEEFTVSRIVPEGPYTADPPGVEAVRPPDHRTAAELGFDDSRYAAQQGTPALGSGQPAPSGETVELGAVDAAASADPRTPVGYGQSGYDQSGYGASAYEPAAYDSSAQAPGAQEQPGYGQTGYGQPAQPAQPTPPVQPAPPGYEGYESYGQGSPQQPAFGAFPSYAAPYTESASDSATEGAQRVGFTRPNSGPNSGPDPAAVEYDSTTSAGLPRREQPRQRPEDDPSRRLREEPVAPATPGNDQWDRGPRREERTGGVTSAGLPRRVPRANLTEHPPSEPTEGGGTQISRHPEDVRGRLSSLHRGVQQGRGAGGRHGTQNDDQER
ncbi:nitrate- and nitrite sensing domain-containing protein [Streptomyces sp. 4N509B]|uniref:nitrate- and nitrite sensing domain-containing protein n=1 Tax=Streptomyces sp. 4N509B TaxID=3457413 RepID=UPI003FD17C9F